jgi:hypothetical protein
MKLFSLACLCLLSISASQPLTTLADDRVLARIEIASFYSPLALPVHALLQDSDGRDYALVFATQAELDQMGRPWRPLAGDVAPEECLLATPMRAGARAAAAGAHKILHDDGLRWLLRASAEEAEQLLELGFELQRLTQEPIDWPVPKDAFSRNRQASDTSDPDPLVAAMIATIQPTNLYCMVARLSGAQPVLAGGKPQLLTTRHTTSGLPLTNALATAFARFEALGLQPVYHLWTTTSYTNRNLSATLPGGARSNELVLITAHLDDMPSGPTGPGADDNASGCAAVLTAAGVLSQYSFERTIRFVLFTGEEQGKLGSANYAAAARNANENIVAVLNLDMIGWDSVGPSTFQLHTRATNNPAYSNDLAIATAFTNAVYTYGLTNLTPVIKADTIGNSDHVSFWNRSFPALDATEDYTSDMNAYYHTSFDTVVRFNMPYFTDAVRAAVAALADLAVPTDHTSSVVLEVANSDWSTISGVGGSALLTRHLPGAEDLGPEPLDLALTNASPNPNPRWLKTITFPYGIELATDSRPPLSESVFIAGLVAAAAEGLTVTCSNRLRFDFLSPPAPDRVYLARVQVSEAFTPDHAPFLCITNLRNVVACGGYLQLPRVIGASPGAQYGTCEIAPRFLDLTAAACPLGVASVTGSNLLFATRVQAGTRIRDDIECTTQLPSTNWSALASFEFNANPDQTSFETGWQPVEWTVDLSALPPSPHHFFRLRRTWLN